MLDTRDPIQPFTSKSSNNINSIETSLNKHPACCCYTPAGSLRCGLSSCHLWGCLGRAGSLRRDQKCCAGNGHGQSAANGQASHLDLISNWSQKKSTVPSASCCQVENHFLVKVAFQIKTLHHIDTMWKRTCDGQHYIIIIKFHKGSSNLKPNTYRNIDKFPKASLVQRSLPSKRRVTAKARDCSIPRCSHRAGALRLWWNGVRWCSFWE